MSVPRQFVIHSLPRSRSAWLARFLAGPGPDRKVGHDLALRATKVEDWMDAWGLGLSGTVETGAMLAWPLISEMVPWVQQIVVQRPPEAVLRSLEACGFPTGPQTLPELELKAQALADLSLQPGVLAVTFEDLKSVHCCAELYEQASGKKFDFDWWQLCEQQNVQIDIAARTIELEKRAEQLAGLKSEVEDKLTQLEVGTLRWITLEPWDIAWPDVEPLAAQHFAEVDGGVLPWRGWSPDVGVMSELVRTGQMLMMVARGPGRELLGYCTWIIQGDVEASGLAMARQGGWYSVPGAGVGLGLLKRSVALLRSVGITYLELHHRLEGRGQKLGKLFTRLGAVPHQTAFLLKL